MQNIDHVACFVLFWYLPCFDFAKRLQYESAPTKNTNLEKDEFYE